MHQEVSDENSWPPQILDLRGQLCRVEQVGRSFLPPTLLAALQGGQARSRRRWESTEGRVRRKGVYRWPVAHGVRTASDGASGRCALIGPHRGRRARRRPLLGSSTRPPCPTPCHATAGAAPMLHPWANPSSTPSATRRGAHGRRACATLLVRPLPCADAGVQPLRPGPDLL